MAKAQKAQEKPAKGLTIEDGVKFIWRQPSNEPDQLNGDVEEKQSSVQIIGERLVNIEKKHGYLKADFVLDDARDNKSPLHKHFEWDDGVAAEKHRLNQARQLIATVYIKPPVDAPVQTPVRAWVNVLKSADGERRYENVGVAMSDELKRKRLLNQALREMKRWQERYAALEELSKVFEAIKNVA